MSAGCVIAQSRLTTRLIARSLLTTSFRLDPLMQMATLHQAYRQDVIWQAVWLVGADSAAATIRNGAADEVRAAHAAVREAVGRLLCTGLRAGPADCLLVVAIPLWSGVSF